MAFSITDEDTKDLLDLCAVELSKIDCSITNKRTEKRQMQMVLRFMNRLGYRGEFYTNAYELDCLLFGSHQPQFVCHSR